jgi:hypothetical protein
VTVIHYDDDGILVGKFVNALTASAAWHAGRDLTFAACYSDTHNILATLKNHSCYRRGLCAIA